MRTILYILMVIASIWLISCGARKSEKSSKSDSSKMELTDKSKSEQFEETKTNSDINIKKSEIRTENNQDQTINIKEIVEPVDPNKPASFTDKDGKKQELNNSKKTTETTVKNNNSKTNVKTDTEASLKTNTQNNKKASTNNDVKINAEAKKEESVKQVDKKQWNPWSLSWLLLIIPILLIWKYRSKILSKIW